MPNFGVNPEEFFLSSCPTEAFLAKFLRAAAKLDVLEDWDGPDELDGVNFAAGVNVGGPGGVAVPVDGVGIAPDGGGGADDACLREVAEEAVIGGRGPAASADTKGDGSVVEGVVLVAGELVNFGGRPAEKE